MAPAIMTALSKRYTYGCDYGYDDCNSSTWNDWGRWVALAAIVVAFLLLAVGFSCFNNRRRRARGVAPMYGTAWMPAPKYTPHPQNGHSYYHNGPYNGGAAAPPYSPQVENNQTGNTFNSNDGYYGGNHGYGGQNAGGIELQSPGNAYHPQRGGEPVYTAPAGPPPGKGEYIVR